MTSYQVLRYWKLMIKDDRGQVRQYPNNDTYHPTMVSALVKGDSLKARGYAVEAWAEQHTIKLWRT